MVKLSKRMMAIAHMAISCMQQKETDSRCKKWRIADIGTDHGFIPIYLVQQKLAAYALAMDVRKGPLARAKEHVEAYGLEEKIELRLSDGLEGLKPGEADLVMITGMGGELMLKILREGVHVRDFIGCWVFSPQSELGLFRHGLEELGMEIFDEEMVEEDGKYYTVMAVSPGKMHYGEEYEYQYGYWLIRKKPAVFKEYIEKKERQFSALVKKIEGQNTQKAEKRLTELKRELGLVKGVYDAMQRVD